MNKTICAESKLHTNLCALLLWQSSCWSRAHGEFPQSKDDLQSESHTNRLNQLPSNERWRYKLASWQTIFAPVSHKRRTWFYSRMITGSYKIKISTSFSPPPPTHRHTNSHGCVKTIRTLLPEDGSYLRVRCAVSAARNPRCRNRRCWTRSSYSQSQLQGPVKQRRRIELARHWAHVFLPCGHCCWESAVNARNEDIQSQASNSSAEPQHGDRDVTSWRHMPWRRMSWRHMTLQGVGSCLTSRAITCSPMASVMRSREKINRKCPMHWLSVPGTRNKRRNKFIRISPACSVPSVGRLSRI